MNPRAPIKKVHFGDAPIEEVLDIRGFNLNAILELDPEFLTDSHHEHHDEVESFVFKSDKPFDGQKLEQFLSGMIQVYGPDLLRYKGVLWMKGNPRRVVFQGVHMMMGGDMGKPWAKGEKKQSIMVFIGKKLPKDIFIAGLEECLAVGKTLDDRRSRSLAHRYGSGRGAAASDSGPWRRASAGRCSAPSGSGKTTLLHVIAGLVRPTEGEVEVSGEKLRKLDDARLDRWRGATVGIVLQALHLVRHLSVRDNLRLAQYLAQPAAGRRCASTTRSLRSASAAKARAVRTELSQGEQPARGDRARRGQPPEAPARRRADRQPRRRGRGARGRPARPSRRRATARRWSSRRTTRA